MAPLADNTSIRMNAIATLLEVYKADADFMRAFNNICEPYKAAIKLYSATLGCMTKYTALLKNNNTEADIGALEKQAVVQKASYEPSIPRVNYPPEVQECIDALGEFAYDRKFRVFSAGFILFMDKVKDEALSFGIEIKFGEWFSDLPPLLPAIPASDFLKYSQTELIKQQRSLIAGYVRILKEGGLKEQRRLLKKHAEWWFEHYVHDKKYKQLAEQSLYGDCGTEGIDREGSIKSAVSKFSRIVKINTQK